MYRLIIVIFVLLSSLKVTAQLNYKKVDSISLSLYQQQKWKELTVFSENIKSYPYNFYLYNLRVGIAYYQLKNYYNANKYFKKALANNSASQITLEYLFWCNLLLRKEKEAYKYYKQLDKVIQDRINYQPKKIFDFLYFEGGKNVQENKNVKEGDITYFSLGLNHNLGSKITLYHSFNYQQQDLEFSKYKIQRYYINPTFTLKNNLFLGIIFNYTALNSDIDFSETTTYTNTEENININGVLYDKITQGTEDYTYTGTINESEIVPGFFVKKIFQNRLSVTALFSVAIKNTTTDVVENIDINENVRYFLQGNETFNEDFTSTNENIIKKDSLSTKYNIGLNLDYYLNRKLTLGLSTNVISFNKRIDFNYIPSITYYLNKKINVVTSYIKKGKNEYYFYNGLYLLNNTEDTQRFSILSNINVVKNVNLYLVYQKDIINYTNSKNISNTYLIGLKYKL